MIGKLYKRSLFGPRGRYERLEVGLWAAQGFRDAYSGDEITPDETDVDHVIPLRWAWSNGASKWSWWKRRRFGSDPLNLAVTSAHLNRSKGDKAVDVWQPPTSCLPLRADYRRRWQMLCDNYGLPMPQY